MSSNKVQFTKILLSLRLNRSTISFENIKCEWLSFDSDFNSLNLIQTKHFDTKKKLLETNLG